MIGYDDIKRVGKKIAEKHCGNSYWLYDTDFYDFYYYEGNFYYHHYSEHGNYCLSTTHLDKITKDFCIELLNFVKLKEEDFTEFGKELFLIDNNVIKLKKEKSNKVGTLTAFFLKCYK